MTGSRGTEETVAVIQVRDHGPGTGGDENCGENWDIFTIEGGWNLVIDWK